MVFDPTTKVLNATISDELRQMVQDEINDHPTKAELHERNYVDIYEKLLRHISANPDAANVSDLVRIQNADGLHDVDYTRTWLFIKQTVDINNSNNSTASDAIRDFTFKTYETYFGKEFDDNYLDGAPVTKNQWMQAISNAIADSIFKGMLGGSDLDNELNYEEDIPNGFDGTTGTLSTLEIIVRDDAVTAAKGFYKDENGDAQFGVWAGNAFFVGAGYDGAYLSHILHEIDHPRNDFDTDKANTYDLFAVMKAITFLVEELDFQKAFNLFTSNVTDAQSGSVISATTFNTFAFLKNAYGSQALTVFEEATTDDIVVKFSTSLLDYLFDDTSTINDEFTNLSNQFILGTVNSDGDYLNGTEAKEIIHGGNGDDTIIASEGNDLIDGGYDYDTVDYRYNDDRVTVKVENFGNSVANRIATVEKYEDNFMGGVPNFDLLYHIEHIIGSGKDDEFIIRESEEELILEGANGDDTYHFEGGSEGDIVIIDDGGELLIDDEVPIFSLSSSLLQTSERYFKWVEVADYTTQNGTVFNGIGHLLLTEVNELGTELGNSIVIKDYFTNRPSWNFDINLGTDTTILGTKQADFLQGTAQADYIIGDDLRDIIFGDGGHDLIYGGKDADILQGGEGQDVFLYKNRNESKDIAGDIIYGSDKIVDFTQGEDRIDISGLGFSNISATPTADIYDLEYTVLSSGDPNQNDTVVVSNAHYGFKITINGTDNLTQADFIGLGTGSLTLHGDNTDETITGGEFTDVMYGYGGNDVFEPLGGNDQIDGGFGNADKVIFSGDNSDYGFTTYNEQTTRVDTINLGVNDMNSLEGIEIIEFDNVTYYWNGNQWDLTFPEYAPEANDDAISTAYNQAVVINVLFNDSDHEDDYLDYSNLSIAEQPNDGNVLIRGNGEIVYTPNSNFSGEDSFIYTVTDSSGKTDTATVNVSVGEAPVNQAPVAVNDTVVTDYESATTIDVLANDSDDASLVNSSVTIDTDPVNGSVSVNTNGSITYTPNAGYDGTDSFVYTVTDADGAVDTATVNLTVNPVPTNYAPDAANDTTTVNQDSTLSIAVLANDSDTEDSSFTNSNLSIDANPSNGTVSINTDGTIAYTPDANYIGADSFTYTLTDSGGETDTATVNISVLATTVLNPTATHNGDSTNNNITAGSGADVLFGYEGDDTLYGVAGDDQLVGGVGDDTLKGYKGNDTYIWQSGDGNDLIQESNTSSSGTDILHMAGGIALSDLNIYGFTSADLKVELIATGEIITIENQYHNDTDYRVESIAFDDGSSYSLLQGATWLGGVGSQNLYGSIYDDVMHGGKDNDTVNGGSGNDTMSGDLGDDTLYGYAGDDTYLWKSGDGNDVFYEQNYSASANDVLHLTGGISFSDLKLYGFTSHDLKIEYIPTGELLTITNQYHSDSDYHIETLLFDDGSTYNLNQAVTWLGGVGSQSLSGSIYDDVMHGGKDNDTVNGGAGNDTLLGDLGDDVVYGSTGDDTYVWQAGRGNDVFIEQNYSASAADVIYLKGGINFNDLDIYGSTSHDVVIKHIPTGETITIQNQLHGDVDYQIESLQFDSGLSYNLLQAVEWRGGAGNDNLDGSAYNDTMTGGSGNDSLKGGAGDDLLFGDLGNDKLYGYTGNDTYMWSEGNGDDTFIEQNYSASTADTIRLFGGITLADLDIYGSTSHDVKIEYIPTGETLTIENQHNGDVDYQIETLSFDDGSTYDLMQAVEWRGGTGNDNLDGSDYNDTMLGGAGNDTLKGDWGDDTLQGDEGVDKLYGYKGNDTYRWESGDGNDWFFEQNHSASANDVLHLTDGLVAADVSFSQSGYDLKITVIPTNEILTIDNQYRSDTDYHIETLLFDNGTTVDLLGV